MTEGDKAFYRTCLRAELRQAYLSECPATREAHLQAAEVIKQRLAGRRVSDLPTCAAIEPLRLAA